MREFFLANARYWIEEFHFDGLRLDATQSIQDDSDEHFIAALTREVRDAAGDRETIVVGENEPQDTRMLLDPGRGGYGLDGLWNDDFHHTAMVALTGRGEAYYSDYRGTPQEFISVGQVRLPLSGAALQVAAQTARHADLRARAAGLRQLHTEPRPDRQLGARPARRTV